MTLTVTPCRICPGRYLSLNALFATIACTLHVFDISPAVNESGEPLIGELKMQPGMIWYAFPLLDVYPSNPHGIQPSRTFHMYNLSSSSRKWSSCEVTLNSVSAVYERASFQISSSLHVQLIAFYIDFGGVSLRKMYLAVRNIYLAFRYAILFNLSVVCHVINFCQDTSGAPSISDEQDCHSLQPIPRDAPFVSSN